MMRRGNPKEKRGPERQADSKRLERLLTCRRHSEKRTALAVTESSEYIAIDIMVLGRVVFL
jgi:hypothetical protein